MSIASTMLRPTALRQTLRIASSSRSVVANFSSSSRSAAETPSSATKKTTLSSCAPGTVLTGLSVLKGQADPVAKADDEYPDWLWTILSEEKNSALANTAKQVVKKGETFDFDKEKKRLRAINKAKIKASNFLRGT